MRASLHIAAVAAVASILGSTVVRSQDRSGPAQPPLWLGDGDYLRWPLPASEQAYASLSGARIKGYINEITAISRKSRDAGEQYWGRITGTPYDRMTAEWVAAQFRRIGLEQVRIQEFDTLAPQWFPTSWDVTVSGGGKTVPLKTAFPIYHSAGTPATTLEPVWCGLGLAADFLGRDVRGKAAVVYGIPTPGGRSDSALSNGAIQRAEQAGAAALFIILGFPGNVTSQPTGGERDPAKMPVMMVGSDDGTVVRELIEKRQSPALNLRLTVELKNGLKTASVWGVLPGTTDENIAVMAHTDSFFEGAMDNASGIGTMIELAEHYSKVPKAQRRRTMTFFTSSAHHSPSGEEAGLRWIHNHMQAMFAKTALIVNCEHTSQVQTYLVGNSLVASNAISARRWFVGGSDRLKVIVANSFKTFGIAIYSRPETRPGGELGVVYTDAPSFHIIDHAIYHTDLDTPALVPEPGLEAAVRAFAKIIDEVNKVDIAGLRASRTSDQQR
ncbi:MAG TPA: M28 family peptidase [Vicinamibacterales bacterium]|nr:M28 family peptidase [Vicinamibacterales bacterium]